MQYDTPGIIASDRAQFGDLQLIVFHHARSAKAAVSSRLVPRFIAFRSEARTGPSFLQKLKLRELAFRSWLSLRQLEGVWRCILIGNHWT